MQIERHDRFGLKTEFSKDKWKKRKEKKWVSIGNGGAIIDY